MATVIGIFEYHFLKKKPLPVVQQLHKQEESLILMIQSRFVIMLGKKTI